MAPIGTCKKRKICTKCFKCFKVYLTCFKCDAVYHAKCLLKVPGFQVDQKGHAICCQNITFKNGTAKDILAPQEELVIGKYDSDKDVHTFGLHKEEDLDWSNFKCYVCALEFTNKGHLEAHYRESCNEKGGLIQESNGNEDLENCLPEEKDLERSEFNCDARSLEFVNKEHQENRGKQCPDKQGGLLQELLRDKAGLVCSFCNQHFRKESYEQHVKWCEKDYSRLDTVISKKTPQDHISAKRSDSEKKYKCNDCKYSSYAKGKLVRHTHIHTNEKPLKCESCNYAAVQSTSLNVHILSKHSNAEKTFNCNVCKYSAYEKGNLVKHMRIHTKERPFKCDMCDYAAIRKGSLESHMLAKHSNLEKRHKCNDCEYSAYQRGTLVRHMRIHTNEKPFRCESCDYAAGQSTSLKAHILAKHSNADKRYKCNDCKYSTYEKGNLVRHMRIHTNESKTFESRENIQMQ